MESFETLVNIRQSSRRYSDKEVEIEKLYKICDVARLAPSACNSQPWKLHIVTKNSSKIEGLRKSLQVMKLNKFLDDVTSYIVIEQVYGNKSATLGSKFGRNDLNSMDIGILASHICFQATELGLGSCMIGAFRKKVILKALGFKKSQTVRLVIAIGYPIDNDPIRKKSRKSLEQVVSEIE